MDYLKKTTYLTQKNASYFTSNTITESNVKISIDLHGNLNRRITIEKEAKYIDFHDNNNKRIKIDDTWVLVKS